MTPSDDAGAFNGGEHALCWVHAERLVHKLGTFTEAARKAKETARALIWWFHTRQRLDRYRTSNEQTSFDGRHEALEADQAWVESVGASPTRAAPNSLK